MKKVEIGYLAGILDGEGCVYVNRRKPGTGRRKTPGYSVKVCVTTTDKALVDWLRDKAKLTSVYYVENPGPNRKPKWLCTWNNTAATWVLNTTLPYLMIKKPQAILGLELLKHLAQHFAPGIATNGNILAYREDVKQQIAKLNKRGRDENGMVRLP